MKSMLYERDTPSKSQILACIPHQYCTQVLSVLNVRTSPSSYVRSDCETMKLLSRKITREQAMCIHNQWEMGSPPEYTAKCLKKPDGIALSVLVLMNLRKKGFYVETEVLLNSRKCDVLAFKGRSADEIWAIELKSTRVVWQRGIEQCKEYSLWSDKPLLAVMGSAKKSLTMKVVERCIGIAVLGNAGDIEIIKEPEWEFEPTKQSFDIFTVYELKKIIRSIMGRCPKYNKKKLVDFLFESVGLDELEKIFRMFFAEKVKTSSLFQLTSVESEVLAAYLMRTAFQKVREAGGTRQYLRENYQNQYEIEELILSELIHRGVLPTLI